MNPEEILAYESRVRTRQVVIGSKMVYAVLLIVVLIYLPGGLVTLGQKRA